MYQKIIKPLVDRILALIVLVITAPIWIVLIVLLAIELRGTPFFVQRRPGLNGKCFHLVKLRTMTNETDSQGNLLDDHLRLSHFGKLVRSLSLDELPQMINVLKGEMSFVGPRPLLEEYLPIYTEQEYRRHDVKPGITGWAQVNGRNSITWKQKFQLDLFYVENLSFFLDCKIVLLTIMKIINRADINASDNVTMEKYNGRN